MKKYYTLVNDWKGDKVYTYDILKIIPQGNWESDSIPWIGVVIKVDDKFAFVNYGEHGIEFHPLKPSLYMRFEKIGTMKDNSYKLSKELISWINKLNN